MYIHTQLGRSKVPKVKVGDINMYYEIHGKGEPLVFIDGCNMCHKVLYHHVPVYAKEFKVISYDNRGVGKSDKPDIPYSLELMAKDLAGLMDVIGINKAHLMGYSMGGRIAEEMAMNYPDKIISLVLVCPVTWSVELHNQPILPKEEELKAWYTRPAEIKARNFVENVLSQEFLGKNPKLKEKLVETIARGYGPPHAQYWHFYASRTCDNYARLPQINAPTLIISGSADKTVTPDNIRLLKAKLPDAELVMMENMPHFLFVEGFDEFNRIVLDFLWQHRTKKA
jgi:pimeloyl-ACP methyl ester carboxylesterase